LLVMSLVVPTNPLTRVRRTAGAALTQLADAMVLTARALRTGEAALARRALGDLRSAEGQHHDLADSLTIGQEAATLSPWQGRRRRRVVRSAPAAAHLERATRNVRVLARRGASVIADREPVPEELPVALEALASAVVTLRDELAAGQEPSAARARLL